MHPCSLAKSICGQSLPLRQLEIPFFRTRTRFLGQRGNCRFDEAHSGTSRNFSLGIDVIRPCRRGRCDRLAPNSFACDGHCHIAEICYVNYRCCPTGANFVDPAWHGRLGAAQHEASSQNRVISATSFPDEKRRPARAPFLFEPGVTLRLFSGTPPAPPACSAPGDRLLSRCAFRSWRTTIAPR
jgi:hypothetical protein